jgi:hypothetical protein
MIVFISDTSLNPAEDQAIISLELAVHGRSGGPRPIAMITTFSLWRYDKQ